MVRIDDIPEDQFLAYDIETDSEFAPYCDLRMIAYQLGLHSEPQLVKTKEEQSRFRDLLVNPNIIKVSYNGVNFDDIVLWRFGFFVCQRNRYDMYLGLKTVAPTLPSYGLKFASWYYFDDTHEPQRRLKRWSMARGKEMWEAPEEMLADYCKHDVRQTVMLFRMIWEVLQQPLHWKVFSRLEMRMAEPLHEMILSGGEYVRISDIQDRMRELVQERGSWNQQAFELSGGRITNCSSLKQVGYFLKDVDNIELEESDKGHLIVQKTDLLEFLDLENPKNDRNKIARCVYEVRDITKVLGYFRSYLNAARYEQQRREERRARIDSARQNGSICLGNPARSVQARRNRYTDNKSKGNQNSDSELIKIPKSYSMSAARTRRFLSSSKFGINFQNQNKRSKVVQLVPPGWLGCWIDSTQIENVVHIWASHDEVRRKSYEADVNWSEYVWLTNTILGGDRKKEELDKIVSPVNPAWSVYKQFKTIKLALNFGMGLDHFADDTGLSKREAGGMFEQVHNACPAIKELQGMVARRIRKDGYIQDPFGHIYSGNPKQAYKIVAYLVQGCGTGSVPKAMTIANYETLHSLDTNEPIYWPNVRHPYKWSHSYAVLVGTTHDECAFRISLGLPTEEIIRLLRECLFNMEQRFSKLFDNIPLRAKLAVSITNAAEQKELNHRSDDFEDRLIAEYIELGKQRLCLTAC